MARKKNTTSKTGKPQKDYNRPKIITLVNGEKVKERYHNDYGSKSLYPAEQPDPEAGKNPKDKASTHKYPPPRKNKVFRSKWMQFIDNVTARESFKEAHLEALTVLCDMYVEYEDLSEILRREGRTYKSVTRFGESRKMHPAIAQLDKVRANIRAFTKQLDLFPKKDTGSESDGEENEWE